MGWLSPALISAVVTLITTAVGASSALGTRTRRKLRAAAARVDAWEEWAYSVRRDARLFNDALPAGAERFLVRALPDWMTSATDDPA